MLLLRASRFLGLASVIYVAFVVSVNVGYIGVVGLWASELFSLTDTLQVNVLLLRNAVLALTLLSGLGFLVVIPLVLVLQGWLEARIQNWPDFDQFKRGMFFLMSIPNWSAYFFIIMVLVLYAVASSQAEKSSFLVQLLPISILTTIQIGYLIHMRDRGVFSEAFFLLALLANLLFFGGSVGKAWARDDQVNVDRLVSIYDASGSCQVRRIARVVSLGIIFFNEYSRAYEFRRFDAIKSIAPRATCVG